MGRSGVVSQIAVKDSQSSLYDKFAAVRESGMQFGRIRILENSISERLKINSFEKARELFRVVNDSDIEITYGELLLNVSTLYDANIFDDILKLPKEKAHKILNNALSGPNQKLATCYLRALKESGYPDSTMFNRWSAESFMTSLYGDDALEEWLKVGGEFNELVEKFGDDNYKSELVLLKSTVFLLRYIHGQDEIEEILNRRVTEYPELAVEELETLLKDWDKHKSLPLSWAVSILK
jgi:hypothetical protein